MVESADAEPDGPSPEAPARSREGVAGSPAGPIAALEVVFLLIAGAALLIAGALLFAVQSGKLPYYENGLYGLLLVVFSLQITTLGKTPFGELGRSVPLIVAGVAIGVVGLFASFIPDTVTWLPRLLVFLCLAPGGLILLVRMLLASDKLRTWMRLGGTLFPRLSVACLAVYGMSMLAGTLVLRKDLLSPHATAGAVLGFGAAVVYLAAVLNEVYREYPEAARPRDRGVSLSTDQVLILFTGVLLLLLGALLVPVNLGLLPFAGSAQVGVLVVLLALKLLATGDTPVGTFPRSGPVVSLGMVFAALGIVSCIVPDLLVQPLMIFVGLLNIAGGLLGLWQLSAPRRQKAPKPPGEVPPILKRLTVTQLALNLTTILFGLSVFVAGLLPGLVVGVVLFLNGCVLLYLLYIVVAVDRMRAEMLRAEAGN